MNIAIFPITSELHDQTAIGAATQSFLDSLHLPVEALDTDYTHYGQRPLSLIYVRTGGTEGIFKRLLPGLQQRSQQPFYLLTSGQSNSLAASMEILSYLRQHGLEGEIIHGRPDYMIDRIRQLEQKAVVRQRLDGTRLGIIGQPSDWLIASEVNAPVIKERLGIELVDIPIEELVEEVKKADEIKVANEVKVANEAMKANKANETNKANEYLPGALHIYEALKVLVARYRLQGLTLRCFDLLSAVRNTGCLALAKLNAEGIVAGCEGDIPTLLTMMIARAMTGRSAFQANPSRIDPETGEIIFAHCTIPLDMVERYEYDTHFESGIGVGIRGYVKEGPVTIFKVSGDLSRQFMAKGTLLRCQAEPNLCRTQLVIRLDDPAQANYFLTDPIGNHHVIF